MIQREKEQLKSEVPCMQQGIRSRTQREELAFVWSRVSTVKRRQRRVQVWVFCIYSLSRILASSQ